MNYATFLERKAQSSAMDGFDPLWIPEFLFPFHRAMLEWAMIKGIYSAAATMVAQLLRQQEKH